MEKVAIVGLGWMGFPLAEDLSKSGYQICGTCTSAEKQLALQEKGFDVLLFDAAKPAIEKAMPFFADTKYCFLNIPPSKTGENDYAQSCLAAIKLFPASCKFIFASSSGVYADRNKIISENELEESDFNANHPVREAELLLQNELKNRLTIIRFAGLYGKDRNPARYFAGKTNIPNGKTPVNLIHLEDCIALIKNVIEQDFFGKTLHACADNHPQKMDFYTHECQKQNLSPAHFVEELTSWKIIDNGWSKQQLGFSYKINF